MQISQKFANIDRICKFWVINVEKKKKKMLQKKKINKKIWWMYGCGGCTDVSIQECKDIQF